MEVVAAIGAKDKLLGRFDAVLEHYRPTLMANDRLGILYKQSVITQFPTPPFNTLYLSGDEAIVLGMGSSPEQVLIAYHGIKHWTQGIADNEIEVDTAWAWSQQLPDGSIGTVYMPNDYIAQTSKAIVEAYRGADDIRVLQRNLESALSLYDDADRYKQIIGAHRDKLFETGVMQSIEKQAQEIDNIETEIRFWSRETNKHLDELESYKLAQQWVTVAQICLSAAQISAIAYGFLGSKDASTEFANSLKGKSVGEINKALKEVLESTQDTVDMLRWQIKGKRVILPIKKQELDSSLSQVLD